jgi:hydrogenase-1 operon protein HyaF
VTLRLVDLGVVVDRGGLGPGVTALLYEIAGRLDELARIGSAEPIDLKSLPLNPADYERLREVLGTGEVEASFAADGLSRIRETGIAGVWWVEHRDARGDTIAELLDIARIPNILCVAAEDVGRAATALRARLAGTGREAA